MNKDPPVKPEGEMIDLEGPRGELTLVPYVCSGQTCAPWPACARGMPKTQAVGPLLAGFAWP